MAENKGGIGVVAIARNEGDRLRRCLESLRGSGATVVYVDSGSTDGSPEHARAAGVAVVALDMSRPFTAARARNEGFARLMEADPSARHVQFLDGDCELADGWLDRAVALLDARPEVAVVFGLRRERFPEKSVYNRLADLEWNIPIGDGVTAGGDESEAVSCGGDALVRVAAFRAMDGFNPSVPAGEEPEFCQRLRAAGWKVVRLEAEMTWHDSAMYRFGQWAKRQVRTGYGALDFSTRFGRPGDDPFRKQLRKARYYVFGWPLAVACAALLGGLVAGKAGALLAGGLLAVAPLAQMLRIAARHRKEVGSAWPALVYGVLTVLAKWPQMFGQLLYLRDHRVGRHARLIEYKAPSSPQPQAAGDGVGAAR